MDVFGDGGRFLAGAYGPGARDQRLETFAQGQWADKAPGSGWLALQAGDVSRPEVLAQALDDELLGIGRAWKAVETWAFAQKLAVVRELIRRYPLHERGEPGTEAGGPGGLPDEWDPRLHHEVAAALGISLVAAGKLVNLTWTLDTRLRGTGQALAGGRLDPGQVRLIADETAILDDEAMLARAEEIILAGLAGCATWTALQRLAQRAVLTVDPEGARRRREKAEREHARLRFWRESWGTCAMQATGLPADEALAANARIEGRARAYKAAKIARPMDILRVMAYLDLINEVTIAQRIAWSQADAATRNARCRDRQRRRAGRPRRRPPQRPPQRPPRPPPAAPARTRKRPAGTGPGERRPGGRATIPDGDSPRDGPATAAPAATAPATGTAQADDGPGDDGPGSDGSPGGDDPGSDSPGEPRQ